MCILGRRRTLSAVKRAAITSTVTAAILTAVTTAIGLALYGVAVGWSSIAALDMAKELNEGIAQLRASLIVEHGYLDGGDLHLRLRNIGGVDVIIVAIVAYDPDEAPPYPSSFSSVDLIKKGELVERTYDSYMDRCDGDLCMIDIYYVAAPLFDPSSPEESRDRFEKLSFGIGEIG